MVTIVNVNRDSSSDTRNNIEMSSIVIIFLIFFLFGPVLGEQMAARLDGTSLDSGLLEIFYNGTWFTICYDSFNEEEAQVACRMLGFKDFVATQAISSNYRANSENILLNGLDCRGNETSLVQCKHESFYKHTCDRKDFVGVTCSPRPLLFIQPNKTSFPLMEGTKAVLECVVSNTSYKITDYKWQESAGGRREGKYLIISNVTRLLNGRPVKCEATTHAHNKFPIFSDILELQVYYGPDEVSISGLNVYDINPSQAQNISLECSASPVNPYVNYSWRGCPGGDSTSRVCSFSPSKTDDRYFVQCVVDNTMAQVRRIANHTVEVNYPPDESPIIGVVPSLLSGQPVYQMDNFTLTCSVRGGKPVNSTTVTFVCPKMVDESDTLDRSEVNSSLMFYSVSHDNQGNCTCSATWKDTTWYRKKAEWTLIVYTPPSPPEILLMTNTPGGIAREGANVSLKCQSSQRGHPAAYYTWTDDAGGRPAGDLLIFDKLTRAHNGRNVTCVANNEFTANRQPVPKATLTLHVHTTKAISRTFRESSENIPLNGLECQENETSLAQCKHEGFYKHSCHRWDFVGITCSHRPLLVIQPNETAYPLMEGTNAVLECVVSNTSYKITDYKWPESAGGRREGKYLIISNVTRLLNGRPVKCGATTHTHTTFNISSDALELQVYYGPDKVSISGLNVYDINPSQAQNISLECSASPVNPYVNYSWRGCPGGDSTSPVCSFSPSKTDDRYFVQCVVHNTMAQVRRIANHTVEVNYPPDESPVIGVVPSLLSGQPVYQGDNFTLTCSVRGGKPVNSTTVTFVCPKMVDESDTLGGSEVNSSLRFYSVSHDYQGNCTCSATWKDTTWYRKTAEWTLIVYTPPSPPEILLMTNTSGGIAPEGANVSLKCQSSQSGHPAAYFTWTEDASGRPAGDLLIFDKLTRAHNGRNVTCVANNEFTANRQPVPKATLTLHVQTIDPKNSPRMQEFIGVVCALVIIVAVIGISALVWRRSRGHSISYRFVNNKASGPYIESVI